MEFDVLPGPDWLTCGVVIVLGASLWQLIQYLAERRLRRADREVLRFARSLPEFRSVA